MGSLEEQPETQDSTEFLVTKPRRTFPLYAVRAKADKHGLVAAGIVLVLLVVSFSVLLCGRTSPSSATHLGERIVLPSHYFDSDSAPLCDSRACMWLSRYLERNVDGNLDPCGDFHAFACSKHDEAFGAAGMRQFIKSLHQLFEERLRTKPALDASALEDCVLGHDVVSAAIVQDQHNTSLPTDCNVSYPHIPFTISEQYFENHRHATVEDFVEHIVGRYPGVQWFFHDIPPGVPRLASPPWAFGAAGRVSGSAKCYLARRLDATAEVGTYMTLWNVLYFSPFVDHLYNDLRQNTTLRESRLEACLRLVDDNFPATTRSLGVAALKAAVPNYEKDVRQLVSAVTHSLGRYLKRWLSGNRNKIIAGLGTMRVAFAKDEKLLARRTASLFDATATYSAPESEMTIPQGLLTVLLGSSSNIDPIFVPHIGSEILRSLLLVPNTAFWLPGDIEAWNRHRHCVSQRTNDSASLDDIVASNVALGPLFAVYRDYVLKQHPETVRLSANFTNEQLFFVIWAVSKCGGKADEINGPLLHFERFTKAFHCVTGQGMVPETRCPFWLRKRLL